MNVLSVSDAEKKSALIHQRQKNLCHPTNALKYKVLNDKLSQNNYCSLSEIKASIFK